MRNKPILLIAGDPNSIFFEILFKSIKKNKYKSPLILICNKKMLINQMRYFKFTKKIKILKVEKIKKEKLDNKNLNVVDVELKTSSNPSYQNKYIKEYIKRSFHIAFKLITIGITKKIINGPINKKKFLDKKFLGVTEYIAKKFHVKNSAMLIYNSKLSVSPLTTHQPIKLVAKNITKRKIINHTLLINDFYKFYNKRKPIIGILGLNPHCETIDIFDEDEKIIKPAIKILKKMNFNVSGPHSADTIFLKNNRKKYDVILGMYHDQVLSPLKAIFEFNAVNITLGLPFLRISPDHGPNERMMGKNLSNPLSLIQAIRFLDKN